MKLSIPLLGACLLVASGALYAQAPRADAGKMKAAHSQAEKACEGKQGDARHDCMRKEMCAQAKDPKACQQKHAILLNCLKKAPAQLEQCIAANKNADVKNLVSDLLKAALGKNDTLRWRGVAGQDGRQ